MDEAKPSPREVFRFLAVRKIKKNRQFLQPLKTHKTKIDGALAPKNLSCTHGHFKS